MTDSDPCAALDRDAARLETAGDAAAALDLLTARIRPGPACFSARLRLARLLHEAGRRAEAVEAVRDAERDDPFASQFQAVQAAVQARDLASAQSLAEAMLGAAPGHPRAIFTLAHLAQVRGDYEAAAETLKAGLAACPANPALQAMLIGALEQSGDYAGALAAAEALTRLEETLQTLWTLITTALRLGANQLALDACERAAPFCAGSPKSQGALEHVRGQCLRIMGRREEAVAAFRASLSADPGSAAAWWGLADMKTHRFTAEDRAALETLHARPDLTARDRSLAAFSLARAAEMDGRWNEAMDLYEEANTLWPDTGFDPARFDAAADRLIAAFTAEALRDTAAAGAGGPVPVFIIGLPRSGSTLVEQILSSHSQIEGTIEQPTLPAVKRRAHLLCVKRFGSDYLNSVGRLSAQDLEGLGRAYLENGALFRSEGAALFTDKLPNNFEHVGLIHKILPRAVILDVRRNPLDCGLSLYKQHFAQGVGYSRRLDHIAAYYNGYLKIMDHWKAVLPGKVLTVSYEALASDPEPVVRAMLAHAGREFEPACLEFHTSKRAVRTASSEQVRQPLNTRGIGVWRAVEERLRPLKDGLGAATLARFKTDLRRP